MMDLTRKGVPEGGGNQRKGPVHPRSGIWFFSEGTGDRNQQSEGSLWRRDYGEDQLDMMAPNCGEMCK